MIKDCPDKGHCLNEDLIEELQAEIRRQRTILDNSLVLPKVDLSGEIAEGRYLLIIKTDVSGPSFLIANRAINIWWADSCGMQALKAYGPLPERS